MEKMSVIFPVCDGQDLEANLKCVTDQLPQSGVITDRAAAYTVSIAYDRIRDALMQDRKTWERFQYLYWRKKYHSYQTVCTRLDDSLKTEYLDRMGQEFKRAMQLGQLRRADFSVSEWRDIRGMVDQALGYTGARGIWKKIAPYIPGWIRRGIYGTIGLPAQIKSFIVGVKR